MNCPKCHYDNREGVKFCEECGAKMEIHCPSCNTLVPLGKKFCGECGHDLRKPQEISPADEPDVRPSSQEPLPVETPIASSPIEGERKYVTALFSDMSGYTAMSERLDPEEVKEITSRIFGEISIIVSRYDGFIEKFIGDAVMAIFGIPKAHEDDPIRAIRATMEIHAVVEAISPEIEKKVGDPISMHTGINTGLVVTGEVNLEKGTHGVAGDTINVAARLSSLAKGNEIVVGPDTYHQAEGYFVFETMEPAKVKGKVEPVQVYKVLSPKEQPSMTRRHHGLRADLTGREVEMEQLMQVAHKLGEGKGAVFSICGDMGTGKTRLIEEFKAHLDLHEIQWQEGQAYAYTQNTPYFPLIDLLNRAFQIKEGDPPEAVRQKLEAGLAALIGKREDIIPFVGSLYALRYPEVEGISPEFWKSRLQEAVQVIFSGLARRAPTVICLEDLHWADRSFMDLLRSLLSGFRSPLLFLCLYRPPFSPFTSQELSGMGTSYQEIPLQDLSPSEAQSMVSSLLKAESIPQDLRRFIKDHVGGNPFYLEEVINGLIESGTLQRDDGAWRLARPVNQEDVPSTVQGVIAARLDHLEKASKRILQEAAVIGRAFLYDILKRCTQLQGQIDTHLSRLERMDLIHARSLHPVLEYVFKSALTQEVAYNGLLKKDRLAIHERIGLVMEEIFQYRLSEFYETLAFHFARGNSIPKAVEYLIKSGEKALNRYAVEESHQYYKEAFDLLSNQPEKTKEDKTLLIDLLTRWSLTYYYRGNFRELVDLLSSHLDLAESLDDRVKAGMFYAWLGFSLQPRHRLRKARHYLLKALEIGEEIGNQQVVGYACCWLSWTCADLGLLGDAIRFGERGLEISKLFPSDHYLYFKSLAGIGWACCWKGDVKRATETGGQLIDSGQRHSDPRSMSIGNYIIALSHHLTDDFQSAMEFSKKAIEVTRDPFYLLFSKLSLGMVLAQNGQYQEAEGILQEIVCFAEENGTETCGTPASMMLGLVSIAKGHMNQGMKMIEEGLRILRENEKKTQVAKFEQALGQFYLEMAAKTAPVNLSLMVRNVGFLLRNVPSAAKRSEAHFTKAIEIAEEIGAAAILGQACLGLGQLHKATGKTAQARERITKSTQVFEECGAEGLLKRARQELKDLE